MRLTYALIFYKKGVPILPCYQDSKAILQGYGPYRNSAPDLEFLFRWIKDQGNNYALATGHSGLVVLDFDDPEVYSIWSDQVGSLADTFTVRTARGYHVYYQSDDVRSWKAEGVEVLGKGKAVMGAYCNHPDGGIYQPINQPLIRSIDTVSDFPLLSNSRPVASAVPDHAPGWIKSPGSSSDPISRIKYTWRILEALRLLQPVTFQSLEGSGKWRRGLCPFHDDHKSSFWIDTERDLFGCHACHAHGDVINLVALTHGISNAEAIRNIKLTGCLAIEGVRA